MRYAVLGDIHANIEALETVLDQLKDENVDAYLCVGDIVGYGPDPGECLRKVRLLDCPIVAGNHEYAVTGKTDVSLFNSEARRSICWTESHLTSQEIEFLDKLPLVHVTDDLTVVHATPRDPEYFDYILSERDAAANMNAFDTTVCFLGHLHVPAVFRQVRGSIDTQLGPEIECEIDEHKTIVNVGSIGQPRDRDPRAAYCIYDSDNRVVTIKRVEYDVEKVVSKILRVGLPALNAERLRHGY